MNKSAVKLKDFYGSEAVMIDIHELPQGLIARSLDWNAGEGTGGMLILIPLDTEYIKKVQNNARKVQSAVREDDKSNVA